MGTKGEIVRVGRFLGGRAGRGERRGSGLVPLSRFAGHTNTRNAEIAPSVSNASNASGATAAILSRCWQHVHPDLYSVYDFTNLRMMHPGNSDAAKAGRRNPIEAFAARGPFSSRLPRLLPPALSRAPRASARGGGRWPANSGQRSPSSLLRPHLLSFPVSAACSSVVRVLSSNTGAEPAANSKKS